MKNLIGNTLGFMLSLSILSMVLGSADVSAQIYKWRDASGRTQYSDKPPVEGFTKASREEIINALQSKELCDVPANTNTTKTTTDFKANFIGFGTNSNPSNGINTATAQAASLGKLINKSSPKTSASAKTVAAKKTNARPINFSAFGGSTSSIFNIGRQQVTAFNLPTKPAAKPVAAPAPIAAAPTPAPVVAKPVATPAAAPTSPVAAPVPVANNTATSTTTPTPTASPTPTTNSTATSIGDTLTRPEASPTTTSNIVQVAQMPAVDISKNVAPALGYSDLRIMASSLAKDQPPVGDGIGNFRIDCSVSHMSNDDPIVYPNQQGAAHHHTFFGNTSINFKTNVSTVNSVGNSTCRGGIANRSAYWVPSMIDTSTKAPIVPKSALWYYKTGFLSKASITAPPKGLRMIAGKMKSTSPQSTRFPEFTCQMPNISESPPATKHIPACPQGAIIVSHVSFPQCWDGVNLDSPDHISHMAEQVGGKCPATHPVGLPWIALNTKYAVTSPNGTADWRLSSDNYAKNGYNAGYSSHADWINGWDEKVMQGIVKNCLQAGLDCGNHMLGDGTIIF